MKDAMQQCSTMAEVRRNIDRIDQQIIALLAERGHYVGQAARIKAARSDIVDRARIEDVVAKVRASAAKAGLDPDLAEAIYRPMMDAFIAFETREYDRLHGPPAA